MNKKISEAEYKETIFEAEKRVKISAAQVLKLAKKQEKEKLSKGYKYQKIDASTYILRKK